MNKYPILAVETSSSVCAVGIYFDSTRYTQTQHFETRKHASIIIPLIDNCLSNFGITAKELGCIAVSEGPGSFTGLRIGLSAGKGICTGVQIPLIMVPTFSAAAFELSNFLPLGSHFFVSSKVNTTEYFVAKFTIIDNGFEIEHSVEVVTEDEMKTRLTESDFVAGSTNWFRSRNFINLVCPSPLFVAKWAEQFGKAIQPAEIDLIEPEYYKEFTVHKTAIRTKENNEKIL